MATQIQNRRGTAAAWTLADPVLAEGEIGIETDFNNRFKIGDGIQAWSALPYFSGSGSDIKDVYFHMEFDADVGTFSVVWEAPRPGNAVETQIQTSIAPANGALTMDFNKNAASIYTTQGNRPSIPQSSLRNTSPTPDVTAFVAGDLFQFEVDAINAADVGNVGIISMRFTWQEA